MNALEDLPLGAMLRDAALSRHTENHSADIQRVRLSLLAAAKMGGLTEVTADDASVIADQLGIPGDRRWVGAVFRNWDRVTHTGRYQPSTLKQRHARPVPVWAITEE